MRCNKWLFHKRNFIQKRTLLKSSIMKETSQYHSSQPSHELLIKLKLPVRLAFTLGWEDWKPFAVFVLLIIRDKCFSVTLDSNTHNQGLSGTLRTHSTNSIWLTYLLCFWRCQPTSRCPQHPVRPWRSPCSWWSLHVGCSRRLSPCHPTWPCLLHCCCCSRLEACGPGPAWHICLWEKIKGRVEMRIKQRKRTEGEVGTGEKKKHKRHN